ncbi:hypothetical protein BDB01DRAFT_835184 [Pilobolus umbonatus]|nr:hypothetical protein BDB01DRAFT_835184 [Pilobolus umbonatus]
MPDIYRIYKLMYLQTPLGVQINTVNPYLELLLVGTSCPLCLYSSCYEQIYGRYSVIITASAILVIVYVYQLLHRHWTWKSILSVHSNVLSSSSSLITAPGWSLMYYLHSGLWNIQPIQSSELLTRYHHEEVATPNPIRIFQYIYIEVRLIGLSVHVHILCRKETHGVLLSDTVPHPQRAPERGTLGHDPLRTSPITICISPHHEDLVSSPANLNRQNAKSRLQQTSVKGPTEEQKTSVRLPKKQSRSILETTIRKGHPSNEHHNQHCLQLKYPASAVKYPVELPPWPEPDYFEYSFTNKSPLLLQPRNRDRLLRGPMRTCQGCYSTIYLALNSIKRIKNIHRRGLTRL